MADIINGLYSLALLLIDGCVVTTVVIVIYVIGIIKYERKYILLTKELEKIEINNMINERNI